MPPDLCGFNYWHENSPSIVTPFRGGNPISREHTVLHELREVLERSFRGRRGSNRRSKYESVLHYFSTSPQIFRSQLVKSGQNLHPSESKTTPIPAQCEDLWRIPKNAGIVPCGGGRRKVTDSDTLLQLLQVIGELSGQILRVSYRRHRPLDVVRNAHELDRGRRARLEDGVTRAPVAVFRLAD